jgi:hypothetical protein
MEGPGYLRQSSTSGAFFQEKAIRLSSWFFVQA